MREALSYNHLNLNLTSLKVLFMGSLGGDFVNTIIGVLSEKNPSMYFTVNLSGDAPLYTCAGVPFTGSPRNHPIGHL